MKKWTALITAALIILAAGCSEETPEPDGGGTGAGDISVSDVSPAPFGGESVRSEPEAPKPVPLDVFVLTADEARELLVPGADGVVAVNAPVQLAALAVLVNSGDTAYKGNTYVLQNDINLYGYDFTPIGGLNEAYEGYMFEAVFDGGGFIISGLTIADNGFEAGTGLFGVIGPDGVVENLHVTGGRVNGRYETGGIAGKSAGTLANCSFRGTVTSAYEAAGGLVGAVEYMDKPSRVTACAANAEVSGNTHAGTFAGAAGAGTEIADCYALGSVTGIQGAEGGDAAVIGGFIGSDSGAEIRRCYANTEVYTKVSAVLVGGFAGTSAGTLESCYYNFTATSNWKPVGNKPAEAADLGVIPCETLELCEAATFEGWDFAAVWDISGTRNRGLPFLR